MDCLSRVVESHIVTIALEPTATKLPQGDQTVQLPVISPALAVHESHEDGVPVTVLATGEPICWLYNFQMIDDRGTS